MSELSDNLREQFHDPEYRHIYADESLNSHIATQIKVLREQRGWTQTDLAKAARMAQPRITVIENIDYSSWSINTLRRLARAFDLRLSVSFETFSSLMLELGTFSRPALERTSFDEDSFFQDNPSVAVVYQGGASAKLDNVIPPDVFQDHMRRLARSQREQGTDIPAPQSTMGGTNAALCSALG
jgi:transcriptional regulator with XRE-family HTH domain